MMKSSPLFLKLREASLENEGKKRDRSRRKRRVSRSGEILTSYGLILPAAFFYLGFQFLPIIGAFLLSLFQWNGINISEASFVGAQNFVQVFQDPIFWSSLRNNIVVGVAVVVIQCGGAFLLAAIIHAGISGAQIFRVVFFVPVVISSVALGMLAIFLFSPSIGLINDFLRSVNLSSLAQPWLGSSLFALPSVVVTFIWQNIGFSMLLFLSALKQVPSEMCEAALVDGAPQRTILWSVVLPIIRPVASVIVLLGVISAFRLFDTVYILTSGGPYHASDVLVTYLYESAFAGNQVGYGNAIGVILFVIIFVFAILQLHFTRAEESSL